MPEIPGIHAGNTGNTGNACRKQRKQEAISGELGHKKPETAETTGEIGHKKLFRRNTAWMCPVPNAQAQCPLCAQAQCTTWGPGPIAQRTSRRRACAAHVPSAQCTGAVPTMCPGAVPTMCPGPVHNACAQCPMHRRSAHYVPRPSAQCTTWGPVVHEPL